MNQPLVSTKTWYVMVREYTIAEIKFDSETIAEFLSNQQDSVMKQVRATKKFHDYISTSALSYEQVKALAKANIIIMRPGGPGQEAFEGPKWKQFTKEMGWKR